MADTPVLSVIVPAYNAASTIGEQLAALARQQVDCAWELVIVDNGSSDETVAVAARYGHLFRAFCIVDGSSQRGSAHARNVGAAAAKGSVLCFCDADDIVAPRWLEAFAKCLAHDSDDDIVAGRLDVETLNTQASRAWRPTPNAAIAGVEPAFAPSGNMAIRRRAFEELGGFDAEVLKSHDVEFSRRAVAAGFSIGFCPEAVVHYRLRSSLVGLAKQAYRGGRAQAQAHARGQVSSRGAKEVVEDWLWLLLRLPTLVSPRRRGIWIRRSAEALGRISGSLTWRTLYL